MLAECIYASTSACLLRSTKDHHCDLVVSDVSNEEGSCAAQYLINRWCPLTLNITGENKQHHHKQVHWMDKLDAIP
jgi:hypothetical protein